MSTPSRCDEEDIGYSVSGDLINVRVGGSTHSRTIREWHALSVASFVTSEIATPTGHDQAKARIEQCVREIEIIADTFGYDETEWLAGENQGK